MHVIYRGIVGVIDSRTGTLLVMGLKLHSTWRLRVNTTCCLGSWLVQFSYACRNFRCISLYKRYFTDTQ